MVGTPSIILSTYLRTFVTAKPKMITLSYCLLISSQNQINLPRCISPLAYVGSNILYNLVAMGVHNIKAVDFDKVELSNLNRQIIYNESDLGQLKSEAVNLHLKE